MRGKPLMALVMAVALFAGRDAWAQGQTLADLAKKEEDRRKALKAPTKVLKAEELPKRAAPPPPAPSAQAAAAATDPKAAPKSEEPEKGEAWWKERVSAVREELRRNEMFADALQTRVNSLTNDASARDDPFQRARLSEDRLKALAELDRVKADIALAKKKIFDIEEEARQAGVPPGWVR